LRLFYNWRYSVRNHKKVGGIQFKKCIEVQGYISLEDIWYL